MSCKYSLACSTYLGSCLNLCLITLRQSDLYLSLKSFSVLFMSKKSKRISWRCLLQDISFSVASEQLRMKTFPIKGYLIKMEKSAIVLMHYCDIFGNIRLKFAFLMAIILLSYLSNAIWVYFWQYIRLKFAF